MADNLARSLDWLLKTADHHPQIIGTFNVVASGVTIEVWDITDGQNTLTSIASDNCYAIGDTGRWGWSTMYLPVSQGHAKHYFYLMTSDTSETFGGQFIMDMPESSKWIHPGTQSDFLV